MHVRMLCLAAALAVTGAAFGEAQAQSRLRSGPPPLTVYKRSYLEPSNQVPVGSQNNYFIQSTILTAPFAARDLVGASRIHETSLPTRFYAPGWSGPQFDTFYTPPYPTYSGR